jgi:hypothetical protein
MYISVIDKLAKTSDTDILRVIVIKLQKRAQAKSATLLIKVKAHRGWPLHEETDIRAEMGRMKEEQEKTWREPTNRTIYQWSETSKTKKGTLTTRQSEWTQTVHNRMWQRAGEIQDYQVYEKRVEKWGKEHIPRKGKGDISGEGQELLEDKDIWGNKTSLLEVIHESRKRVRINEDNSCPTKKGQSRHLSQETGFSGRVMEESY